MLNVPTLLRRDGDLVRLSDGEIIMTRALLFVAAVALITSASNGLNVARDDSEMTSRHRTRGYIILRFLTGRPGGVPTVNMWWRT